MPQKDTYTQYAVFHLYNHKTYKDIYLAVAEEKVRVSNARGK